MGLVDEQAEYEEEKAGGEIKDACKPTEHGQEAS